MCCQSNVPHTCHTHLDESVSNQVCLQLMSCSVSTACTQCECSNNFAQQVSSNHNHFLLRAESQCGTHQSPRPCRARVVAAATFDSSRDAASSCALLKPSQTYWRVCGLRASLAAAPSVTLAFPFVPILPQGHSHKQKSLKFIQIH